MRSATPRKAGKNRKVNKVNSLRTQHLMALPGEMFSFGLTVLWDLSANAYKQWMQENV